MKDCAELLVGKPKYHNIPSATGTTDKMMQQQNSNHDDNNSDNSHNHHQHHHHHGMSLPFRLVATTVTFMALLSILQSTRIFTPPSPEEYHIIYQTIPVPAPVKLSSSNNKKEQQQSSNINNKQREITFITLKNENPKQRAQYTDRWFQEAYSGMWWQKIEHFLKTDWKSGFTTMPITASFKAFQKGRARQTRDWLDFSVEHLSIFWKHFEFSKDPTDNLVYATMEERLKQYIDSVPLYPDNNNNTTTYPGPETIALLPFSGKLKKTDSKLRIISLAATLASLWQIRTGRCVVVGHSDDETKMILEAFDMMDTKIAEYPMELEYVRIDNVTPEDLKLMPKVSLLHLQSAMKDGIDSEQWLGTTDTTKWKFLYFTEPDLILHTRPSAMESIRTEMTKGGVMTAHRFMPLPHQRSFPQYTRLDKVVPDIGMYSIIHDLDNTNSCCDSGNFYPSNPTNPENPQEFLPCGSYLMWWRCGFFQKKNKDDYTNIAKVAKLHHRIPHPLVSITYGTGWPLIHNNQRICFPKQIGECD